MRLTLFASLSLLAAVARLAPAEAAVYPPEYGGVLSAGYFDADGVPQSGQTVYRYGKGTLTATSGSGVATSTALPASADPAHPGPFATGTVAAGSGETVSVITRLIYYAQVSGAYDPDVSVLLHADIFAAVQGTASVSGIDSTYDVSAEANAIVALSFYSNEAMTQTDYMRGTYDSARGSSYTDTGFSDTVAKTLDLMVHPGETFSVFLEIHPFAFARGAGSASAYAKADPYFYFDAGSPYSLEFSDGVENGPVDSAVPEPASWALLMLGFGFTGTALRRRRFALG